MFRLGKASSLLRSSTLCQRRLLASTSNQKKKDKSLSPWYPVLGGLFITVSGGIKYTHDHFGGWEGISRAASFYSLALPKYVLYRYHMWADSPDHVWDALDKDTSQLGLQKILELRAFYIKSGQMVASNMGNGFNYTWRETMSVLQDQCPPREFPVVKEIVETELGKPLDEIFATFDQSTIGAASIGQVHRATLLDGTQVVVKVMYPEVERYFRGDVRTIKLFCQLAQPVHVPALEEVEKQFMTEFDYRKEAKQLATVRQNLIRGGFAGDSSKMCIVPEPYLDLCTKSVLVMEEIHGEKLPVVLEADLLRNAERAGQTKQEFLAEHKAKEDEAKTQGTEFLGPSNAEFERYRSILNKKRLAKNTWGALHNLAVGLVPGFTRQEYQEPGTLPLNTAKLIDDLIYVHGYEALVDGYFQGDPHPGNILLPGVEDGRPQLGLIDYGQVKRLDKETRHILCKMVIALADDNREEIVNLMKLAGYKSRDMNEDNMYLYAKVGYDEDNDELTGGLHIQMFMEGLQATDPIYELPVDLLMVSRMSVMLRGLAHALKQSRSVAKIWKPIAEHVLRNET